MRCVFTLPSKALKIWFPNQHIPPHLAYVEWFTPFSTLRPSRDHRMYKISRLEVHGKRRASVIPVEFIRQSVHLIPTFGAVAPSEWKLSNVLEYATEFFVNSFSDCFQYSTLF